MNFLLRASLFGLTAGLAIALTACSRRAEPAELPREVARRLAELRSLRGEGSFILARPSKPIQVNFRGEVDLQSWGAPQMSGWLTFLNQTFNGGFSLTAEWRQLEGVSYFRLASIDLPAISPLVLTTQGAWYRLGTQELPAGRFLGFSQRGPWTMAEEKSFREFLRENPLFRVEQNLGLEVIAGRVSYHLRINLELPAWERLLAQWGERFSGTIDTAHLLNDLAKLNNRGVELWVTRAGFYPVKLRIPREPAAGGDLVVVVSEYNRAVKIEAPKATTRESLDALWWDRLMGVIYQ